ncbi:hypothetical protein [Sphingomonas montana]|uniref:GspE/PulE/PilB domain-containing protein n=1 Tax=Sphingomonas montana TaxID=1843236 RepID=UPI0013EADE53|nr:hypothetical protein [Sphingomonas montana]
MERPSPPLSHAGPAAAEPGGSDDIDPAFLAAHGIVPIGVRDGRLVVAMPDPLDAGLIAQIAFAARRPVTAQPLPLRDGPPAGAGIPTVPSAAPAPSLAAGIFATLGGGRRTDWLAVEMMAQLVADGAARAEAVRRVAAVLPARTLLIDRIAAGALPPAWGTDRRAPTTAALLPAVAAALRGEVTCAAAVRQALAVPVLSLILAGVMVGVWGIVLALPAWPLWGAAQDAAAARRTCRALARGDMVVDADIGAVLTPAEQDRIGRARTDGAGVAAVIAAVEGRTQTAIRDAGGRAAMATLLLLAMLLLVRLG